MSEMPNISIDELNNLRAYAKRKNINSIDELIEDIASRLEDSSHSQRGLGSRLAAAREMNYDSGSPDTVEKSREILSTEFPDYLKKRMENDGG